MISQFIQRWLRVALASMFLITGVFDGHAWAQTRTLAQWQSALTSSWTLKVQGEPATRQMRVGEVTPNSDGTFTLDTLYGMSGGKLGPMRVEITPDKRMVFTTGADAKVVASESENGDFVGTITYRNGVTKPATLSKTTESQLQAASQPLHTGHAAAANAPAGGAGSAQAGSGANSEVQARNVILFYFGTNSCPTCRAWKSFDLPKLKEAAAFQAIRFVEIEKGIPAPIPSADSFPADLAPLRDAVSNRFKGRISSPMFAMVAGGEVKWAYMGAPDNRQILDAILAAGK